MSTLGDRLRALAEALPANGTISLTKADLLELVEGEPLAGMTQATIPDGDLNLHQVAGRYGRSPSTVRDWVRTGRLRAYKLNGREWRVTPSAIAAFEANQRRGNIGDWRHVGS